MIFLHKRSGVFWYNVAILNVLLATGITQLFREELRVTPMLVFGIATAFSTMGGNVWPGILAAVLSAISFDLLITPPDWSLDLTLQGLLRVGGLVCVVVGFSVPLTARAKAEQKLHQLLTEMEAQIKERTQQLTLTNVRLTEEIAERTRAEDALRLSEQYYRSLIEQSSDIITVINRDGTIRYESPALKKWLGYNPKDVIGTNALDYLHPEDQSLVQQAFARMIQNKLPGCSLEYRARHFDGSWRMIEAMADNRLDDLAMSGIIVVSREISSRRAAEEALRLSEARLREANQFTEEIIYNAGEGIIVYDCEMRYQRWNRWMEELTGFKAQDVIGRHPDEIFPNLRQLGLPAYFAQALAGETVRPPDREIHLRNGSRVWISGIYTPHRNSTGEINGVIVLTFDVTDRKYAEKQMEQLLTREQEARFQAETASRLKDEFLATLSHELRTPLSAILGWSRLLRERQMSAEKFQYALEVIERNAHAQTQLINDLLDVSRIISGKLLLKTSPVDLATVISSAVNTVHLAAEAKEIQLELDLTNEARIVSGDADRLQQIVWNLLSNAVKFTPQGGRIQVALIARNEQIQICVTDSGQGISPEFLPYVFDRFSQADSTITRRHGGLGLGLAIVRHLTELHGGTVRVVSGGQNQGATFIVSLPLLEGRTARHSIVRKSGNLMAEHNSETENVAILQGRRIIVVDDDPDTLEVIAATLQLHGAVVVTAATTTAALEALQQSWPDLLISDISMPGEDGYTLIQRVRAISANEGSFVPALALTALARSEDREAALNAGYQQHLAKPADGDELLDTICHLLSKNYQVDDQTSLRMMAGV